jgi:peptidoglycan/LPS O-acetylase OafA/YrhL
VSKPGPRLRELDLLRFVAALAVMFHHQVGGIAGWGVVNHHNLPGLAAVTHFGLLGVDLFFLVSGFVILMSAWDRGIGDFAVSRVVRIFPAYWFAVCLAMVVFVTTGIGLARGPGSESMFRSFLPNLTMLEAGTGSPPLEIVYWTLWVEVHFYALIALLIWRGISYQRCVLFMGAWLLLGAFAQEAHFDLLTSFLFPQWAPYFIAGMAFYLTYRYGPNLVLGLFMGVCWALAIYYRVSIVNKELVWPTVWPVVVSVVITVLFLLMWLVATRRLSWVSWRGSTVLGALTYPLYLVHETIRRPLQTWLAPQHSRWAVLAASVTAALIVAYLVDRFVERPAQRWLRPRLRRAVAQIRSGGLSEGLAITTSSSRPPRGQETASAKAPEEVLAEAGAS